MSISYQFFTQIKSNDYFHIFLQFIEKKIVKIVKGSENYCFYSTQINIETTVHNLLKSIKNDRVLKIDKKQIKNYIDQLKMGIENKTRLYNNFIFRVLTIYHIGIKTHRNFLMQFLILIYDYKLWLCGVEIQGLAYNYQFYYDVIAI